MAPMVGPPGMILWLTVALVLVVLLLVPGRGRRSRVALAGVTFAAGIVFFSSASQNRRGQSGMAPPAPRRPPAPRVTYEVPPAPAPPPTAIGEQVGVEIQASTSAASAPAVVIRGLPPISGVAEDWLNRFGSPVRFEGSKLIIEGHVPALSAAESSSQPADVEWQQDEERE